MFPERRLLLCSADIDRLNQQHHLLLWQGVVLAASKIGEGRSGDNRFLDDDTISSGNTGDSRGERDLRG